MAEKRKNKEDGNVVHSQFIFNREAWIKRIEMQEAENVENE